MKRGAKTKISQAIKVLEQLAVPKAQLNQRSALTLLALADLTIQAPWKNAQAPLRRITEIMNWVETNYRVTYAPNTRETFRRQTMHQFMQLGFVVENPDQLDRPINSPKWCYQLSDSMLEIIRHVGQPEFEKLALNHLESESHLSSMPRHRTLPRENVRLPSGKTLSLTAGGQNVLIKRIVEDFCPRFVKKPQLLLLGDAGDKNALNETEALAELGIIFEKRGKAPDVVIHDRDRNWLVVIEAVTSHGPIDQKRKNELEKLLENSKPGVVYVTAFLDRSGFKKYQTEIAWETEVWISDAPDHMIHFNGVRFLGPYEK